MNYNYALKILPEADSEFLGAALWYERQQEGLGNKFITAVEARLKQINQSPELYPKRRENFRETLVDTFPFAIVIAIHQQKKQLRFHLFSIPAGIHKKSIRNQNKKSVILKMMN